MRQHVELVLRLALHVLAAVLAEIPTEGPLGGHRRDRLDGRGHVHQQRPQVAGAGDIGELLDQEF